MTFLEFICRKLIGPPVSERTYTPQWECPFCSREKLYIKRPDAKGKVRFKCWSCEKWGDAADLIAHFHPELTDYQDRCDLRDQLCLEWEASGDAEPVVIPRQGVGEPASGPADEMTAAGGAWASLTGWLEGEPTTETEALLLLEHVLPLANPQHAF